MDHQEMFMLWVNLERAYFDGPHQGREVPLLRLTHPPWESPDEYVQKAWRKLTAPENLDALLEWRRQRTNEKADSQAEMAIEACRNRVKNLE